MSDPMAVSRRLVAVFAADVEGYSRLMGDVMVRGGDLFGDGVNIAARLQALAQPSTTFYRCFLSRPSSPLGSDTSPSKTPYSSIDEFCRSHQLLQPLI